MAKVTTDDTHYKCIADSLRYYDGDHTAAYTPAQMAEAVGKTCRQHYDFGKTDGYGKGYAEGQAAEKAVCRERHYCGHFYGNDSRALSLVIPFEPQLFLIYTTDPYAASQAGTFMSMAMDLRSFDRYMGSIMSCNANGNIGTVRLPSSQRKKLFTYQGGVFTFQPAENQLPGVLWRSGVRYSITAANFGRENTAAAIVQRIADLPDEVPQGCSGQLVFHKETVENSFFGSEWEQITAQKPNWTFTLA